MHYAILVALDPNVVDKKGLQLALVDALTPFDENIEDQEGNPNPDGKWDWYQLGGRWTGFFLLKDGETCTLGDRSWTRKNDVIEPNRADVARKRQLDIEGMKAKSAQQAREFYAEYMTIVRGEVKLNTMSSMQGARGKALHLGLIEIDQDGTRSLKEGEVVRGWTSIWEDGTLPEERAHWRDFYKTFPSEEAFMAEYGNSFAEMRAYGILDTKGVWHDRRVRTSGWAEMEHHVWAKKFDEIFASFSDDTVLAIVDIHS